VPDHATSADAAVQAQLDRLWALSPGADVLGLERITRLLARLGNPERRLPPVFHVAGTNGKGSTCAFLRAALEAAGYRVHVYSSPHLARFNERIRVAGQLIEDVALAPLLREVLDEADGIGASFFEVTTAAAFLHFARTPADACVIEVGLGGRLDATNVIPAPAVCGIAALGIDHQAFLGDALVQIAAEKAGIAKPGVPLVTMEYPAEIAGVITQAAGRAGAPVHAAGRTWRYEVENGRVSVTDENGTIGLPQPALAGAHQAANLALAAAMLRRQRALDIPLRAMEAAATSARWPARLQKLSPGPLVDRLPPERRRHGVWLDGAHNEQAATAIACGWAQGGPAALVIGMLANKDANAVLRHLMTGSCEVVAVPVPGHAHHLPATLVEQALRHGAVTAQPAESVEAAFDLLADHGRCEAVLIAGSLYLAGGVLVANDELPT
jgi:dihydrofolate synthase/folylpolyglutamate synthase